jgi:hypothetical protein
MINLRITTPTKEIGKLAEELPRRIQNLTAHIGRVVAQEVVEQVKRGIPRKGGWYATYREAISAFESDGREWLVAGVIDLPVAEFPAESTLLTFPGGDASTKEGQIANVLVLYNPWTTDALPISGSELASITPAARTVASSDVSQERKRLTRLKPAIIQALTAIGAVLLREGELITIDGKLYTDVVGLASLMETGADGYPKQPAWQPAFKTLEKRVKSWAAGQKDAAENIMRGGQPAAVLPPIDPDVRQAVAGT